MGCTQNWPCTPEFVVYQRGAKPKYITPPFGIVWQWIFLNGGRQVAIHYGFTHGDAEGEYGLYDVASLKELDTFTRHTDTGSFPAWVLWLRVRVRETNPR